jgi:hypothetical protein
VGGVTKTITAITSATSLTVDSAFGTFSAQAFTCQTGITQTSTDTMNLSLGSATGFTITNRGDLFRTFNIGGQDLFVEGTLTVESRVAQLCNDGSCANRFEIRGSASGGEAIFNGRKAAAANAPFPYPGFDWLGNNGNKVVKLVSTNASFPAKFTLIDACVRFGADWLTTDSGNFSRISTQGTQCWILCARGTGTSQARIRQDNTTATIDFQALKTWIGVWLNFGVPQLSLKGYTPIDTDGPEINLASVPTATRITLEDYNTTYVVPNYYAGAQIVLLGGAWARIKNNLLGTNIVWMSSSASGRNVLEFSKQITIKAQDSAGNLLSDGYLYYQPVGSNVAGVRAKGGTVDITFDLTQQVIATVSGTATSEFVYAWGYTNASGNQSVYNYFCTGTTKAAESHLFYSSRYGYDTQPLLLNLSGNGIATVVGTGASPTFVHASLPTTNKDIPTAAAITGFTFNFSTKTWTHAGGSTRTVQEMYDAYQLARNQPANLGQPNDCVVTGNLRNWVGWTGINNGSITGGTAGLQLGSNTITNNGSITTIYFSGGQSSSILQLIGASPAAAVAVWHPSTTATELFQTNVSGSAANYTVYYPPGSVGLVKNYARELFGSQRVSGSITLAAGLNTVNFVDIPDISISNTSQSVVTAYTTVEGPSKRYDRTAIFRLTEQGIKLGQIVTRSGTNLEGTFSVVVRDDAPAVYSVLGNVITIKAASYEADSKYIKELVTGGGTFTAFDTELITIDIEDANGDSSVLVQGTTGGLVDVWKCVNGTINSDYATGTKIGSNISSGKFRFTGTDGFKLIFYDKNTLLARDCSMSKGSYVLGWYLYDAPTGGLTQEQNVNFSNMVTKVNDIFADVNSVTTGFVEATDNLHAIRAAVDTTPSETATAVWTAATRTLTSAGASGATLAEIEASTVLAKQAAVTALGTPLQASAYTAPANSDIAAIKSKTDTLVNAPTVAQLEASALAKQSDVAFLGSPLQASAYVEPANSDIAAIKAKTDTLINTDISGLATAVQVGTPLQASAYTAPANSDIAAIKAKTDTLVNAPTVAQLEASALAKQSAVTALGSPLQASAYVAPPTATAIATAVEVAIITENDGNAVLQAIADKIGNENLSAAAVASAVRTELATELSKLDATVSSRLATTGYTAPANSDIAAIKSKTDTLVNAPTVAELEASELAKQASVVALGSPLQASAYTAPANSDIAAIKAKTDTLVNTDTTALAKKTDVEVVNQGVKNASLLIPHTTNLPT